MQPVLFEESGLAQVEKALNQLGSYKEKGCKIHFVNLSSNVAFDRIRQLKKVYNDDT